MEPSVHPVVRLLPERWRMKLSESISEQVISTPC
jgi:hypothetical protein